MPGMTNEQRKPIVHFVVRPSHRRIVGHVLHVRHRWRLERNSRKHFCANSGQVGDEVRNVFRRVCAALRGRDDVDPMSLVVEFVEAQFELL